MLKVHGVCCSYMVALEISEPSIIPNLYPKPTTWRIIPLSKWLITMVSKSPKDVVIPLPNGLNGL